MPLPLPSFFVLNLLFPSSRKPKTMEIRTQSESSFLHKQLKKERDEKHAALSSLSAILSKK